jgi:hypothetical protein
MVKTETDDLITMAEAARLRKVTHQAIADLVKRGRLNTVEVAGRAHLYRSEVLEFEPEKGGRPSKKASAKKNVKRGKKR